MHRTAFAVRRAAALAAILLLALPPAALRAEPPQRARREPADIARFRARAEAILAGAHPDATRAARERVERGPLDEDALAPAEVARRIRAGHWGVLVADADTGEVLYARNAASYFTPASNTKLFSTALALALLGPDYRFRTTVEARGTLDPTGRLRGALVLVGRGDPSLTNRVYPYEKEVVRDGPPERALAALADQVAARGVRVIEGDIVADDSHFPPERFPPGWAIDDMAFGYGAPVSAVAVHDNLLHVTVTPGAAAGEPAEFTVEPWAGFYELSSTVETVEEGGERRVRIERAPGRREMHLWGTIPAGARPLEFTVAVEEPAEHAAALFLRLLEARGIRVYGRARARHAGDPEIPGDRVELAEHLSPPLLELARLVNKISQNLHAELLLRAAAVETLATGERRDALDLLREFLLAAGLPPHGALLEDGSGLSRLNKIAPETVVGLLAWIARQPWGEAYRSTLPVAGEDGTLTNRMKDTAAAGRIFAKTGTLESGNALAGYATTLSGRRLMFSVFGNLHALAGRDATGVIDALCVAMVEEIGRPGR